MKILLSGYHNPHYLTVTEYIERAVRCLGHKLIVFNDRDHLIPGRMREGCKPLHSLSLLAINRRLLKLAERTQPDLIVVTGGHRITRSGLRKLNQAGFRVVLWTTDPPKASDLMLGTAHDYRHVFCQGTEYVEALKNRGVMEPRWLPMASDPEVHRRVSLLPEEQLRYGSDIVFVGSYYACRAESMEPLVGFGVSIWGPGWEHLPAGSPLKPYIRGAHTPPETWLKIYCASKIVLSIHARGPEGRFPMYQASPRIFEALACEAFVLSDRQRDVLSLFKDNEHLATFNGANDLREKVSYFLAHADERLRIAAAGRQEVSHKHTYIQRLETLLRIVGAQTQTSPRLSSGCPHVSCDTSKGIMTSKEAVRVVRPKKVAHLVEDMKVGGIEKVIAAIALGLDKRRYAVEIWCLAGGGAVAEWLIKEGVRVRIFSWQTYHNPLNIIRLAMQLHKSQIDIVHTHGYYAGTFGRLAAIIAGISPVFAHVHTSDFTLSRRHCLIEKVLSFFTLKIICISQHVKGFVESQEGIRPEKTALVYNGTGRFFEDAANDPLGGSEKLTDDDFVIVSVGSLVKNKGHHVLIEAVRMLCLERPPIKVLIAGDGPQRSALQDLVDRCGLSSTVMFVGVVKDVRQVFGAADIFVLPTVHREGLSLAVLEAMQHGLPVIASRIGGVPELVDDSVTGILVTPNDPRILAQAITTLTDDKQLRCQMGESGRKKIDRLFRVERMVEQIESLYESA